MLFQTALRSSRGWNLCESVNFLANSSALIYYSPSTFQLVSMKNSISRAVPEAIKLIVKATVRSGIYKLLE